MNSRRECRSSSEVHCIRLRGPWQCEPLRPASNVCKGSLPAGGRIKIPDDWGSLLGDFFGRVDFRRRFGCPSGLESHEQVELVIEQVGQFGQARLNGHMLGALEQDAGPYRFPITGLLQPRNELQLEIEHPLPVDVAQDPDLPPRRRGIVGEVRLEISRKPG